MQTSTPYPARRRYPWALDGASMTYTEAVRHFTNMRYQSPKARNPERWATLETMVEALHVLQHEGVDEMPGLKLHKLLVRCAAHCGWLTNMSAKQRTMRATPIEGDPTRMHCWACDRDLSLSMFRKPMTIAQKERYGKPLDKRTYVMQRTCADCRDNAAEARRRKKMRTTDKKNKRDYVRLTALRKARAGDVYRVYLVDLRYHTNNTRQARTKATCVGTRGDFYNAKLALILAAQDRLEQHVEDNTLDQLDTQRVTWLNLVTSEERRALFDLYTTATHDPQRRGRLPVFETPLELK